MTSQKGRDFLLKIGDGEVSESFTALGAVSYTPLTLPTRDLV